MCLKKKKEEVWGIFFLKKEEICVCSSTLECVSKKNASKKQEKIQPLRCKTWKSMPEKRRCTGKFYCIFFLEFNITWMGSACSCTCQHVRNYIWNWGLEWKITVPWGESNRQCDDIKSSTLLYFKLKTLIQSLDGSVKHWSNSFS